MNDKTSMASEWAARLATLTPEQRADLPFVCPFCGSQFGLGDDAALLCIATAVPINGEATPCCGTPFYGGMRYTDATGLELVQAGAQP